jgi:hypothetical protein
MASTTAEPSRSLTHLVVLKAHLAIDFDRSKGLGSIGR